MSFYECDIPKETQWSGNKICISNIFGAVISNFFFFFWEKPSAEQTTAKKKKKKLLPSLRKQLVNDHLGDSLSSM